MPKTSVKVGKALLTLKKNQQTSINIIQILLYFA